SPGCAWDICLCGRRGLHRKLPGQLFWSARDCEPFRQNRSRVCFVLLGWRHGWTISWRGTAPAFQARIPASALRGAGSDTGSGLLNMAIVGGAILPVIQGVIADQVGLHHAFILPVICYLYILYYGLSGSKPNSERYARA